MSLTDAYTLVRADLGLDYRADLQDRIPTFANLCVLRFFHSERHLLILA
jgi:hypothetical protein